jgi:hypothetical protein
MKVWFFFLALYVELQFHGAVVAAENVGVDACPEQLRAQAL